ncbi:MAG: RNA polymerase sigma-70 factor [Williamsia sp.]|nr:RNA polymerase sigma-70 factor [Williamsia sp.]
MFISSGNSFARTDEKELLDLLNQGESRAFTEIYNRYWKKLFTLAANKLDNLAEAEELVQDIFTELWNRRGELAITTSLASYLAVAAKYKVIDLLAKKARHRKYQQHAATNQPTADSPTLQWLDCQELKERMYNSVARLPEKCRLVFELSRHKGYSQKQIASRLGISEKTVEAHLGKALRTLRTSLSSFFALLLF